jgi:hypothetical protein
MSNKLSIQDELTEFLLYDKIASRLQYLTSRV